MFAWRIESSPNSHDFFPYISKEFPKNRPVAGFFAGHSHGDRFDIRRRGGGPGDGGARGARRR
jgi:hypothetical protein